MASDLLLDHFDGAGVSALGTRWEGYTDRVMGGLTDMTAVWLTQGDDRFLRLEGQVRTENNGGFLQMRLPLAPQNKGFDARPWAGLRLRVQGFPGSYAVHLRTPQNWFPWNYFTAPLPVTDRWADVTLPFTEFREANGGRASPELRSLRSVALVAIGQAFQARLEVSELSFYGVPHP